MTRDQIKQEARRIAFEARTPEWEALNGQADDHERAGEYAEAESVLLRMSALYESNLQAGVAKLPADVREMVWCEINVLLARLTGVIA